MFRLINYLKFIFRSTNEHGVHSPFIYQYLTKCLYQPPKIKGNKAKGILWKSIPYFGSMRIYLPEQENTLEQNLYKAYPQLLINQPPYDVVLLPSPDLAWLEQAASTPGTLHKDSLVIIDRIHASPANRAAWSSIRSLPGVRVTIDGFYAGLVFFREEQARQHFRIRI